MTFHPPAWHTPPNGHTGVTHHVPRGREHDITIRTGAAAVPPSDLCGAVSRRDRGGRRTSGRSRGACRLGAGNNVPHPGGSAGVLRAYVSRARGRGARGALESRAPLSRCPWYRGAPQRTLIFAMSHTNDHREHRRYFAASLQVYFRYVVPTPGMLSVSRTHRAG